MVLGLSQLVNVAANTTHLTTKQDALTKMQGHQKDATIFEHFNVLKSSEKGQNWLESQGYCRRD